MKKLIRLTENELTNLVKKIVNERMEEDNLSDHIKIYHMYKNGELDKKTFYSFVGILDRHEKERLMDYIKGQKEESLDEQIEDVYSDSSEDFQYDIRGVRCDEDTFTSGHVDIDEDDVIVIRYCKGNEDSIERLKRKGEMILRQRYDMNESVIKEGETSCEDFISHMRDIYEETQSFISRKSDKIRKSDEFRKYGGIYVYNVYEILEDQLGYIVDMAEEMECDNYYDLLEMYEEYTETIAEILGLDKTKLLNL
jgi:hypothetical protein